MDVSMSSFKIKLLKALAITNTPLFPPSKKKHSTEILWDHFWPRPTNVDQGGVRGGLIVVPNPWDRISVGKKVQNS